MGTKGKSKSKLVGSFLVRLIGRIQQESKDSSGNQIRTGTGMLRSSQAEQIRVMQSQTIRSARILSSFEKSGTDDLLDSWLNRGRGRLMRLMVMRN